MQGRESGSVKRPCDVCLTVKYQRVMYSIDTNLMKRHTLRCIVSPLVFRCIGPLARLFGCICLFLEITIVIVIRDWKGKVYLVEREIVEALKGCF
jgi:hypothetical protein